MIVELSTEELAMLRELLEKAAAPAAQARTLANLYDKISYEPLHSRAAPKLAPADGKKK